MWNNSYLNCGCRWKWRMLIAVKKKKNLLRWAFFAFVYNRSSKKNYFIYTSHHFTPHGKIWTQLIDLVPNVWLHSSVGRASHRYHGGHGFESRWSPDFFRLRLSNCLNWKFTAMSILHFQERFYVVHETTTFNFCVSEDPCEDNPCKNNGYCVQISGSAQRTFRCDCHGTTYFGRRCHESK